MLRYVVNCLIINCFLMLKYQVVESAFYGTSLTRKYTFAKLHGYSKDFKEFSVF